MCAQRIPDTLYQTKIISVILKCYPLLQEEENTKYFFLAIAEKSILYFYQRG